MQDFTGVPAIVDLAAMRDAMDELGGDPAQDQPAGAGRARDRPLDPGRRVRRAARLPAQRRARVRAQPRALRLPALGPERIRQLQRRAAQHRHLPPGQPRVPGPRGRDARRPGLPRHAGRHRLAHHDDQRPRRARLGRGRHRGRGGDARPAGLDADPAGGRLPADRRAAGGLHRHRPRAHRHPDAARARRRRQVRRVLRPGPRRTCRSPTARRSGTCRPSTAPPAGSSRWTPRRSATSSSPGRPAELVELVEAYCSEQGLFHDEDAEDATYSDTLELDLGEVVPIAGRAEAARRTAWRCPTPPRDFRGCAGGDRGRRRPRAGQPRRRGRRVVSGERSAPPTADGERRRARAQCRRTAARAPQRPSAARGSTTAPS